MTTTTKTRPSKAKAPAKKATTKPRATKPPAEPTPPPAPTSGGSLTIEVALLKKIISCVAPAASNDEARPLLMQLRIEPNDNGTTDFVATDSYRLHNASVPVACGDGSSAVNLPAWWLARWARSKYDKGATATIMWSAGRQARASATISVDGAFDGWNDVTETVKLLGDSYLEYPKWRPLLTAAVDNPGEMAIAAFNPRFLAATLAACAKWGDAIPVRLNPLKPTVFRANHHEYGILHCLIMPVRVPDAPNYLP